MPGQAHHLTLEENGKPDTQYARDRGPSSESHQPPRVVARRRARVRGPDGARSAAAVRVVALVPVADALLSDRAVRLSVTLPGLLVAPLDERAAARVGTLERCAVGWAGGE